MNWVDYLPALLQGAGVTAAISAAAIVCGGLVAFVVGIARVNGPAMVRTGALVYTEVLRGTSLMVQLFWFYYALPLVGLTLPPVATGVLVLSLHVGAYGSEIVRGALQAVSTEQQEAARALNFGRWHTLVHITLPQAVVEMVPAFGNLAVETLKMSSLVSLISIVDLTFRAQSIRNLTLDSTTVYTLTLVGYFAMALVIAAGMRRLERWVRRGPAFPRERR